MLRTMSHPFHAIGAIGPANELGQRIAHCESTSRRVWFAGEDPFIQTKKLRIITNKNINN